MYRRFRVEFLNTKASKSTEAFLKLLMISKYNKDSREGPFSLFIEVLRFDLGLDEGAFMRNDSVLFENHDNFFYHFIHLFKSSTFISTDDPHNVVLPF